MVVDMCGYRHVWLLGDIHNQLDQGCVWWVSSFALGLTTPGL